MKKIAIIGAGQMAEEYIKVLKDLNIETICVSRSESSSTKIKQKYEVNVFSGGVENNYDVLSKIDKAIVAVDLLSLKDVAIKLAEFGVKDILLEKPGSLTAQGINELCNIQKLYKNNIYIAYNRRFFQSVKKLKELILKEGGLTSVSFSFTEWSDQISELEYDEFIKNKWLICNSSHVIDLFIFLAGKPKKISTITSGSLDWHPSGSMFTGHGFTENNTMFSYHSDWESSGRWGLQANTKQNKYFLEPLEQLTRMKKNSINLEAVELETRSIDKQFKPGIYHQTKDFIDENPSSLCSLEDHLDHMHIYEQIAGYKTHKV